MATPDLTKLRHMYAPGPLHLYFERQANGTNILRHIRVNQRTFQVPTDVTIDSVGTEQIIDGSVQMQDLGRDVQQSITQLAFDPSADPTQLLD